MKIMVENVALGHVDRFCDYVSERILDVYKKNNNNNYNYAIETMAKDNNVNIIIETTDPEVKEEEIKAIYELAFEDVYKKTWLEAVTEVNRKYNKNVDTLIRYNIKIDRQSPEIEALVDKEEKKAGDNGIIYGYDSNRFESISKMVGDIYIKYRDFIDYKYIVGVIRLADNFDMWKETDKNLTISVNCDKGKFKKIAQEDKWDNYVEYQIGNIFSDTGLTGRKLMCDTYFGLCNHGGGNVWGKDPSKVDKSGKFYARWLAKSIRYLFFVNEIKVKLVYTIGKKFPDISFEYKKEMYCNSDRKNCKRNRKQMLTLHIEQFIKMNLLTVQQVIDKFNLNNINLSETLARFGNLFSDPSLPWEDIKGNCNE